MSSQAPAPLRKRLPAKPLRTMAVGIGTILVLVFGDYAYGTLTSSARIDGDPGDAPAEVIVHLPFEPQRYHVNELRNYGTYHRREDDGGVRLRSVSPRNLERLGRLFWIERVEIVG
ncbi:MAG: hypothetical protein GEU78_14030 [Actinobacteria bacterium]|nr:hypothetical protein [Actinomycetota bacterium]